MRTGVRSISPGVDSALMVAGWSATDLAAEVDSLAAPQLEDLIPALASTISRFEAVRLDALRAAERAGVHARAGMRSTAEWAAAVCGDRQGRARADCDLAGRLDTMPEVAAALADGGLSKTQATALAAAAAPTLAEQADLVDAAGSLSVLELERHVERFNRDRERPPDPVEPSLTVTHVRGRVHIDATLDSLGGELVSTAIDAAHEQLAFDSGTGLAQRRAAGLTAIARHFLEHHDQLHHRLGRPHVVVEIPISTLTDGTGSATIGAGGVIDAATARRLACDASLSRLITGPAGEPLDVGRATRTIPTAIARQLLVEDHHCRWPGCQSPAWSCEAHHVKFWEGPDHGDTALTNLVLLCWHHHHLLHADHHWQLTLHPASRQLHVTYQQRSIGTTVPPGRRRRTGPAPAPATPAVIDPTPECQSELFDVACSA